MNKHNNILVMFCDQLRLDLLGCYGSELVRTPNIDRLASDSIVFDNAYTPTAICSPARASLMTGLYAHQHHMFNNSSPSYSYCHHLRPDISMIQDWADEATNYQTGYFGKWHIGPADDLFNSRFHHTHPQPYTNGPPYLGNSHWHPNLKLGELAEARGNREIAPGEISGTVRTAIHDFPDVAAARYCRQFIGNRDPKRPFLAFCAFPGPHSPWLVPEEFGIRYDPRKIPLWDNRDDPLENKPINQQKLRMVANIRQKNIPAKVRDENLRQKLSACFSYLELIDQCVGEMIDYLKDQGLYRNTTIFFTADHGDMAGSHGFPSKGPYMYDEIYRIPMLFKPAGAALPGRVGEPVHLMDVTATCMELMAGRRQTHMNKQVLHGQSLQTFIGDNPDWPRQVHYAQYHGDWYGHYSARMVTDGQWKLVWNFSDLGELYDLRKDPGEISNRFYDPAYRDKRQYYFARLAEAAENVQDGQSLKWLNDAGDPGRLEELIVNQAITIAGNQPGY